MARFTRTISAGGGDNLDVSGSIIAVIDTTDSVEVMPSNRNAYREMTGGDRWELKGSDKIFTSLHFRNQGAASITITLDITQADDDVFTSISRETTVTKNKVPGSNANGPRTTVTGASTELVAANSANRLVTIQPIGGAIHVALGEAATTDFLTINDGDVYEIETTEAVNAIRSGSTSIPTFWKVQRD